MPAVVVQFGQTLLLSAHLICIDLAMIGPLVALVLARRQRRRGDEAAGEAGRWLMHLAWKSLTIGMVLGLLAGVILWYGAGGRFAAALVRLPDGRLYWGVAELAFYYCLVVPCAMGWNWFQRRPWLQFVMAAAASANLVYHFPSLFVIVGDLAHGPVNDAAMSRAEFRNLVWSPHVTSQVVHYLISAVAVVGVALLAHAWQLGRQHDRGADATRIAKIGARLALVATLLQIPVGLWTLMEFPPVMRDVLLGSDPVGTALFIAALALALALLHYLAAVAMGDAGGREIIGSIVLLALIIVLMAGTLRRARDAVLPEGGRMYSTAAFMSLATRDRMSVATIRGWRPSTNKVP